MSVEKRSLWQERIEDYHVSQLSAPAWCEQNQVSIHTFRYWIKKFEKESMFASLKTEWLSVKVPVSGSEVSTGETSCGIHVNIGRVSIEVSSGFDPQVFEAVVRILSAQC